MVLGIAFQKTIFRQDAQNINEMACLEPLRTLNNSLFLLSRLQTRLALGCHGEGGYWNRR